MLPGRENSVDEWLEAKQIDNTWKRWLSSIFPLLNKVSMIGSRDLSLKHMNKLEIAETKEYELQERA